MEFHFNTEARRAMPVLRTRLICAIACGPVRQDTNNLAPADSATPVTAPYWVKLARRGNVFSGYSSSNGLNWDWVGTQQIDMTNAVYAGIAVSGRDSVKACTATVDNLAISPSPSLDLSTEIGR